MRRSRKRRSSEDEYGGGPDFSFELFRSDLNRMFFRDRDVIRADTPEYENFWTFLHKYLEMEKKSEGRRGGGGSSHHSKGGSGTLNIPHTYDKRHCINFSLSTGSNEELLSRLPPKDEGERKIPLQKLESFKHILAVYLDFLQKEKFAKLSKLRRSQANLPIAQFRDEIVTAVSTKRVVIIAGDTGCGKSTQVPQYLLRAGFKRIACTQPRRIACIALTKRVAYETLNEFGSEIGYQIRFERRKTQHTRMLFLTEGLLLRQVSSDSMLSNYDVVVLDEVHERHLHGDFLLGIMKCLVRQREDVRIVLMSATINIPLFQNYFGGQAPVLQVPGRLFPIRVQYRPISAVELSSKSGRINPAPYVRIMQLVDSKYPQDERGDLLVFLSGATEISIVVEAAKEYAKHTGRWVILPLHSTLSVQEQDRVFDYPPEGVRKCVVATNIAETSVTIDGVRFVADSGKMKEMTYDPESRMQRLKEFWVSQASAEQRKGRAGRTGPGVCFRLYSEADYQAMNAYSMAEIHRVPLDSLVLQMLSMGLPDARKFPFIESPGEGGDGVEKALASLKEQVCITMEDAGETQGLTPLGRALARLPVDVGVGKMLVMGSIFRQGEAVMAVAAALSVQTPFTNRAYRDTDCMAARKSLESDHGDPITLFNAFQGWLQVKADPRGNSRRWCRHRGLEEQRFYETTKLRQQFKELLQDAGLLECGKSPDEMSSSERTRRHGEMKRLRHLKREYHQAAPRKKRILDMHGDDDDVEGEEEKDEIDIKDVEFRMKNDSGQVEELLSRTATFTYQDIMLIKIILCSGLYPQFAIADAHNSYKSDADQLFHTRAKSFVVLHPLSSFANDPEVLCLRDTDIVQSPGFGKLPVSSKHQLLCYLSLLETTKPYLMSSFRMPAAQTLLLFCQSIDTNERFSRMVCDSWIELQFPNEESGETLLVKSIRLRELWEDLIAARLKGTSDKEGEADASPALDKTMRDLDRKLARDMVDFLHTEVCYTIQRLLPADIKNLYVGPIETYSLDKPGPSDTKDEPPEGEATADDNPFEPGRKPVPHQIKGGLRMTDFLTYNCLVDKGDVGHSEYLHSAWTCPHCEISLYVTGLERVRHQTVCKALLMEDEDTGPAEEKKPGKAYYCDACDKELYLTPIDILRHKKEHMTSDK